MKTTLKRILSLVLTAVLLCGGLCAFATALSGTLTVTLEDKDKKNIEGLTVHLCQIATLDDMGYYPSEAFEASGISIAGIVNNPDEAAASTVTKYVLDTGANTFSMVSKEGKVTFSNLPLGIYVVFPAPKGAYTFNPYIVFLPYEAGGKLVFELSSAPKLEENKTDELSLYVVKKWDDQNNASKNRPTAVTVDLLDGKTVVDTATLSEQNGWAHTFTSLNKTGDYSVREHSVAHYEATYGGSVQDGLIITNTYVGEKLPQTGQYWWPIVLIAIAGVCFVLLGFYEMGEKKNGKKS